MQPIYLADYKVSPFNIKAVHINFNLHEEHAIVKTILDIERNPESDQHEAPLVLDGESMQLKMVAIDGKVLADNEYKVDDVSLTIAAVPNQFTLETEVLLKPHENTTLMGLYKSRKNFCTQCEAEGFRRITYYLDRPDVLSHFTTTIEADKAKYPHLLSNGNLIATKELAGNRHWVKWEDPSLKPCYLFALVAGDFDLLKDTFTTMSGKQVDLELYTEKGFGHQGDFALASLKRAMQWDEETWGREYDLNVYMIVAISDFNMGAMENKGLNVFNTKYVLAKPETATDTDYVGIEAVIGHEYFHNWSGNRVTCRDWFQITLKEGLTVFRDQSFTADMTSKGVSRIDTVNIVQDRQFKEDAGPMSHPIRPDSYIEINNFYTLTVYRKGAEVIRMVQTLLTPPVFRKGLDLYFSRFDGQAVTTDHFIEVMEEVSNQDLTQFKRWYTQAGTPLLDITSDYNAVEKTFTLNVRQTCPHDSKASAKEDFYIPLAVGLLKPNGEAIRDTKILVVKETDEQYVFNDIETRPIPALLRNFSAPVKVKYPYTDEELAVLWQHESDPFCRWDAGQTLMTRIVLSMVEGLQQGWPMVLNTLLVEAVTNIIEEGPDDLEFRARLLCLPSDSYIHQQMQSIDVHRVYEAKKFIKKRLGEALESLWLSNYQAHKVDGPYVYSCDMMGQRAFKNICLSYLVATGNAEHIQRAYQQFQDANNMTDTMAALSALNHQDCVEREQALNAFYQRWHEEPLVINKWLQLQATSTIPNAYQKVMEMMSHQAFDVYNPNNVYALICSFGENHIHFHDLSGSGYQFIADQVIHLQAKNPQVAARILQPLTHWRSFPEEQGTLMRAQLERIANVTNLSSDIYELVTKSLH